MKNGEIIFNNRSSLDLNLFLEDYPSIPSVNEEYETEKVLSMDGELHYNLGTYPDREIEIDFDLVSDDLESAYRQVESWLGNITDNRLFINSDKCFKVKKIIRGEYSRESYNTASFPITFICYPYRYDSGDTTLNIAVKKDYSNGWPNSEIYKIINYGDFNIKPIIKILGSGYVEVEVYGNGNDRILIIEDMPSAELVINSELESFNFKATKISGEYPVFVPGVNYLKLNFNTMNGSVGQDGDASRMRVIYQNKYR